LFVVVGAGVVLCAKTGAASATRAVKPNFIAGESKMYVNPC
jgi:hypothetical protein